MAKKATDLDPLVRLRRYIVDERRRELGQLNQREEQLLLYRRELEKQIVREGAIAIADPTRAGYFFGSFAADHRLRRENAAATLAAVRREIEVARDALAQAYRDRRVIEEVRKNRADAERAEADRVERIELDEIAQNQHRQKG